MAIRVRSPLEQIGDQVFFQARDGQVQWTAILPAAGLNIFDKRLQYVDLGPSFFYKRLSQHGKIFLIPLIQYCFIPIHYSGQYPFITFDHCLVGEVPP